MGENLTRVQRRQRETREQILRVALELFRQKGFDNTTVAEITAAADIGKGTFFTYFPTKEAIFGYLGEIQGEAMVAALNEGLAAGAPVAAVLEGLFLGACAWHEANRPLTEQVVMAGLRHSYARDADAANRARMLDLLTDALRRGQERGEFAPGLNPQDGAVALVGVYFSVLVAWLQSQADEERPLADRMRAALALVLHGMAI